MKTEIEEEKLKSLIHHLEAAKQDVELNIKEISVNINFNEFRDIMGVYWAKLKAARETLDSQEPTRKESKIRLPLSHNDHYQQNTSHKDKETTTAKEFSFSKLWDMKKCRPATSWEDSQQVVESTESIVQQIIPVQANPNLQL